jgi:hypothetical protein
LKNGATFWRPEKRSPLPNDFDAQIHMIDAIAQRRFGCRLNNLTADAPTETTPLFKADNATL